MTAAGVPNSWAHDAAAPFKGWDFSYLRGRFFEAEPSWGYLALARAAVAGAFDVLDVATGGGEVFASLAPFPGRATAVEGYEPNLAVARRRLEPLGVPVFQGNTRSGLPFLDEAFDLVLNRHGGFRPAEMHRILKPGGVFLTQQVGGDNLADLTARFGATLPYPDNTVERMCEALTSLGMRVRRADTWSGPVTFCDVGALVYFLKAVPWVIAGFEIERYRTVLMGLQAEADRGRKLEFTYTRFLLEAVRT